MGNGASSSLPFIDRSLGTLNVLPINRQLTPKKVHGFSDVPDVHISPAVAFAKAILVEVTAGLEFSIKSLKPDTILPGPETNSVE